MFTGIVTELGRVQQVEGTAAGKRIVIAAPGTVDGLKVGDSVAVNGVCLTAIETSDGAFSVQAVAETLDRSNLGVLGEGDRVDLERPVAGSGGRFDGHVVQGHVDGVGTIATVSAEGEARRIRVSIPQRLAPYVVEKGSVTVDGVSLTVTAVSPARDPQPWFDVVLIPHTIEVTVLGDRVAGDTVNLEADIFAKYVERLMEARG